MEPKSSEQLPTPIERTLPSVSPEQNLTPERAMPTPERGHEQQQTVMPAAAPVPPPQAVPLPIPIQPQTASDDTTGAAGSMPAVAADEDLIEKEWVDKAKTIIAATKDDPHAREREVGKLQADYLKKRYGKELGNQA